MTTPLYPLRFTPIFRRYLWGGRKLGTHLAKQIGTESCAESWEICDRGAEQSIVAAGPLAGVTLRELVAEHCGELFGRHAPQARFPLLFKLLDAREKLSVQVHPDDRRAQALALEDPGKTEAWIVLHAEPGSLIYAGLKRGFDRHALEREVSRGTCELCLHSFAPREGDCIFLPAGVVHALGAGLVVAEIQQSSDVTWRLFDWNRLGPDGQPRALHIEAALDAIDYHAGPLAPVRSEPTDNSMRERLVSCGQFVLDRLNLTASQAFDEDERFHILCVVEGEVTISGDPTGEPLRRGDTLLLPARRQQTTATPTRSAIMLDAYLP